MAQPTLPLLKTKLFVVHPRPGLVRRERLAQRLDEIPHRRLTLISAPAGFGKTTLLSAWIADREYPAAWYSLDRGDNDVVRFLTYMIAALQTLHPEVGTDVRQALQMSQLPPIESLMASLINGLTVVPDAFLLVLEDYHEIENEQIHQAISFLLEHAPSTMHIAMTTRIDPPMPLARFRVRGELLELRASDLRFSPAESAAFLNELMRLGLSAADVGALESKTEGWAAGLQMAALSLQGRQDVGEFISAFTGADKYVIDYLLEEVVSRQPREIESAMLDLSILDRFNVSLFEALTGRDDGEHVLETLERDNLFLIPLDNRREWYRYHHLFSDLLRHRLRQMRPDALPELHRRASRWFEEQGLIRDATLYAARSEDPEFLARFVERRWRDVTSTNLHADISEYLSRIPEERVFASARLLLVRCWMMEQPGQTKLFPVLLDTLERLIETEPEAEDLDDIRGQYHLQRVVEVRDTDPETAIHHGELALKYVPERLVSSPDSPWLASRGLVYSNLGGAHLRLGNYDKAMEMFEEALRYGRTTGDLFMIVSALSDLGRLSFARGKIAQAERYALEQLEICRDNTFLHPVARQLSYHLYGMVMLERNDLAAAEEYARKALGITTSLPPMHFVELARLLFTIYLVMGNDEEAERTLGQMEDAVGGLPKENPTVELVRLERLRLEARRGNLHDVADWVKSFAARHDGGRAPGGVGLPSGAMIEWISYGRMLLELGELSNAIAVFEGLRGNLTGEFLYRMRIGMLVLLATAYYRTERVEEAVAAFTEALELGAPERIIRPFVQEGKAVVPLLMLSKRRPGAQRSVPESYLNILLDACGAEPVPTVPARPREYASGDILDPLTNRELEILQLMAEGHSNRRIAEKLYVSVNTIKTHVSNLFSKLDAENRVEALAHAREAGIL